MTAKKFAKKSVLLAQIILSFSSLLWLSLICDDLSWKTDDLMGNPRRHRRPQVPTDRGSQICEQIQLIYFQIKGALLRLTVLRHRLTELEKLYANAETSDTRQTSMSPAHYIKHNKQQKYTLKNCKAN